MSYQPSGAHSGWPLGRQSDAPMATGSRRPAGGYKPIRSFSAVIALWSVIQVVYLVVTWSMAPPSPSSEPMSTHLPGGLWLLILHSVAMVVFGLGAALSGSVWHSINEGLRTMELGEVERKIVQDEGILSYLGTLNCSGFKRGSVYFPEKLRRKFFERTKGVKNQTLYCFKDSFAGKSCLSIWDSHPGKKAVSEVYKVRLSKNGRKLRSNEDKYIRSIL